MTQTRIASLRDRGTWHRESSNSARRDSSLTSCDQRALRAIGVIAMIECMRSGWLTPHWSACIPPIEAPMTVTSLPTPRWSSSRRCDSTMSRMVKRGNWSPGWDGLLEGDDDKPLPSASATTTQ